MSKLKSVTVVLFKVVLTLLIQKCNAEIYYVTPSLSSSYPVCPPSKPCHTLDEYASNEFLHFGFNDRVHLLFLDGSHEMSPGKSLELSGIELLTLSKLNDSLGSHVVLKTFTASFITLQKLEIVKVELQRGSISTFDVCLTILNKVSFRNHKFSSDGSRHIRIVEVLLINSRFTFSTERHRNIDDSCYVSRFTSKDSQTFEMYEVQITGNSTFLQLNLAAEGTATIQNTRLSGKNVVNVYLVPRVLSITDNAFLEIINCSFNGMENMYLSDLSINKERSFAVSIINCSFFHSKLNVIAQKLFLQNASIVGSHVIDYVMFLKGPMNVSISSSTFDSNQALISTLRAENINMFFSGITTFSNNIGSNGGAIQMSRSTIWLEKNTQVSFINNTATQIGGAISISEQIINSAQLRKQCFYQLNFDTRKARINTSITFSDNLAQIGGDNIYGAALQDDCIVNSKEKNYEVQESIFQFQTKLKSFSSVSSDPKRICLCNAEAKPQCNNINYIYFTMYITPGEKFNLSLVIVGEDFGTVTGGVYASQARLSKPFKLSEGEDSQQINSNKKCTNLEYSLHSANKDVNKVSFILSRDSIAASSQRAFLDGIYSRNSLKLTSFTAKSRIRPKHLNAPVVVTAFLLPCPLGLELHAIDYQDNVCLCAENMRDYVHNCVVKNGVGILYRNGSTWIGSRDSNLSVFITAHSFCPFGYCTSDVVGVDLNNSDSQCALNRSGVLCGGCPPGLSLAIGSSRCIYCPENSHVTLLLVFMVAGVALVSFIRMLDLTVAHGTINGLIFYANSVWIHEGIFFAGETSQIDSRIVLFMKTFIAWLNLDFGIETCFFNGLNSYSKTWLQFVFPFYIWTLAGLIVLACHYSTRATKLFGNNTLPVLTTMFLLSYTKLLRTIVLVLGPAILQQYNPEGKNWVWLLDGNVPYLGVKHAFLFLMALFVLIFLWLPYTMALLFARHLYKLPFNSIHRKLITFKPLLDTYTGPLQVQRQFWVGLTLLIRVLFAVSTVVFQAINPVVNIDILLLISVLLCMIVCGVYKKLYISILELSYLLNLIFLCIIFLSTSDSQIRLVSTCLSVGVCLFTFIWIVCFHSMYILLCLFRKKKLCLGRRKTQDNNETEISETHSVSVVTTTIVDLHELLLENSQ